jgi:uncharacterized membrane protein
MQRLESARELDTGITLLSAVTDRLNGSQRRRDALQGHWAGHAIHPALTDLPIGAWVSASTLDLIGGKQSRPAATRLVAVGIAAALPTAITGLAEWGSADWQSRRVGLVHAVANTAALSLYSLSLTARLRDRHRTGALLALAGASAATVGGYLGGHLTEVRKVGSYHPAYDRGKRQR